jgi:hypothetical protein
MAAAAPDALLRWRRERRAAQRARFRGVVVASIAAVAAGGAVMAWAAVRARPANTPARLAPAVPSVDADHPGTPAPPASPPSTAAYSYADGVLAVDGHRYALGRAGDVVVIGDWDCDGNATAALYRQASGWLYLFDRWAAAGEELAPDSSEFIGTGRTIRVPPRARPTCDEVEASN